MTKDNQRWSVPTAEEVAAAEEHEASRKSGTFSWVRKLRLRTSVSSRRSAPKAAVSTPPATTKASPPSTNTQPRRHGGAEPASPQRAVSSHLTPMSVRKAPPSAEPSMIDGTKPAASVRRRKGKIKINPDALDRRTGRGTGGTLNPRTSKPRELRRGPGYGACTCGQKFYGPPDVVMAAFAAHNCGTDRGAKREGWEFDR
jgi:hypothetical protein